MKKILLTLLAVSILAGVSAQNKKCGIDTKAFVSIPHFLFCAEAPIKMLIAKRVNNIFFMGLHIYIKCKDTKNI